MYLYSPQQSCSFIILSRTNLLLDLSEEKKNATNDCYLPEDQKIFPK